MFQGSERVKQGTPPLGSPVGCAPHATHLPWLLSGVWGRRQNSQLLNKWLGSYQKIQIRKGLLDRRKTSLRISLEDILHPMPPAPLDSPQKGQRAWLL